MTPAELRAAAERVKRRKLIPRVSGSQMDADLSALADAARRLADVIDALERQLKTDIGVDDLLRIARGETGT